MNYNNDYYGSQHKMIRINLDKLSAKIGKNISEIARETGINRNTITALYHNKVDGIKFATLEILCSKYNLELSDILELAKKPQSVEGKELYKQEGELYPFTSWPPALASCRLNKKYFHFNYRRLETYFKDAYSYWYFDKEAMRELATDTYARYGKEEKFSIIFDDYMLCASVLENYYFSHDEQSILQLSEKEVLELFKKIRKAFADFWSSSLFIDSYDEGFDQEEIKRIAHKFNLDINEVGILTLPAEMTFSNERVMELLRFAWKYHKTDSDKLGKVIRDDPEIRKYIRKFYYYKSNYGYMGRISYEETEAEIRKYLKQPQKAKMELEKLENYSSDQQKRINAILKKHKLKSNPLFFFNRLTYWREIRKKTNLMGVHLLFYIMENISAYTGIDLKYVAYSSFDEVENILRGLINKDILKRRSEKGIYAVFEGDKYKIYEAEEANSLRNESEKKLSQGKDKDILYGQVASQGYAKGIARVITNVSEFDRFKEGEVLITAMTRPEFVPLMRKAIAIVTNEGGITSHAAIVSRELDKPCIIGTKNATQVIHDGDLVEVRAHHGTVRVLERSNVTS